MQNNRFEYLDSSRGVAALTVVLSHFFGAYGLFPFLEGCDKSIVHFFWHGDGAVGYFFVLSGYVLSIGFFNKKNTLENFSYVGYLIRRILRIFPLFIISIWISFFLLNAYTHYANIIVYPSRSQWVINLWQSSISIKDAFKQSLLLIELPNAIPRLLPQGWTLESELIGSALIPVAVILFKKEKALFFLFFIYLNNTGNWTFIAFVLGMLIANYRHFIEEKIKALPVVGFSALFSIGVFLYTSPFNFLHYFILKIPALQFKFQCFGSAIFLICLISSKRVKLFLSKRIFVFMGKISYGIYLTHFFILIPITPLVLKKLNENNISGNYDAKGIALISLILVTILISTFFHKVIELPFIRFGKKVTALYFTK